MGVSLVITSANVTEMPYVETTKDNCFHHVWISLFFLGGGGGASIVVACSLWY